MDNLKAFFDLCSELNFLRVPHEIRVVRDNALMVSVAVPGERWEIEFHLDGAIEVERFQSLGVEADPGAPFNLLKHFDEKTVEPSAEA